VVAYVRVSSRQQDERGSGLATQRAEIERAARARGERVARWFSDVETGGTFERAELGRLRAAVARGDVQTLWIWSLDRLTRTGILDTLTVLREFRAAGCEVRSVADPFPLDGAFAEPMIALMAWCAQKQRERIKETQAAGIARMQREGRRGGRPVEIGPDRRAAALQLRGEGLSVRQIARRLKCSKSSVWNFTGPSMDAE
jgi:DNA invertase Pin-like site-specific DNA recombinase